MLHYQKLFQRMVEGVLVIKKGREKYGIIRQMVTDCNRLKGRGQIVPLLIKTLYLFVGFCH